MANKSAATYHPHNTLEEAQEAKRLAKYEHEIMEPRQADIDRLRKLFPYSKVTRYECPQCGWHVSSHPPSSFTSGYWNCPNGASPAFKEGRIKPRGANG
jgi:predicted RNA-binding Zn-ribbon protein involved in translation (DUF1610 family)